MINPRFNGVGNAVTETLQREGQKWRQKGQKKYMEALEMMKRADEFEMPVREKPMKGLVDLLPLIAAPLIGKLFGAKQRDIAGFGRGYMGARQQSADARNEENMRRYGMQTDRMRNMGQIGIKEAEFYSGEADRIESWQDKRQARVDRERDLRMKSSQDELGELRNRYNQANTPDEKRYFGSLLIQKGDIPPDLVESAAKRMEDEAKFGQDIKTAQVRTALIGKLLPFATNDEDRTRMAKWASSLKPEELQVALTMSEQELLTKARRETENAMRPGKVKAQEIINKHLDAYWTGKARVAGLSADWLAEKIQHADEIFALPFARLAIAEQYLGLANNRDARAAVAPRFDIIKSQMAGHDKRYQKLKDEQAKVQDEINSRTGTLTGEDAKAQDAAIAKFAQIEREMKAIEADKKRLEDALGSVMQEAENAGSVQIGGRAPAGVGEFPAQAIPPDWGTPPDITIPSAGSASPTTKKKPQPKRKPTPKAKNDGWGDVKFGPKK